MGFTKIVTLCILVLLVYDDRRKFVSAQWKKKPTNTGTFENTKEIVDGDEGGCLMAFEMQVAGHGPTSGKGRGLFRDPKGNLLKSDFKEKEVMFYENLATTDDPILLEMRNYVPRYCGLKCVKSQEDGQEYWYLCMEDQTRDFTLASVMDVKIGKQFWKPGLSEDKIRKRKSRFAAMKDHYGFCIPGTKFYHIDTEMLKTYVRPCTYTMSPRQSIEVLYEFVNRESGLGLGLVRRIVDELRKIYSWFKRQQYYKLYGSSILIVYDTASLKMNEPTVRVRIIDFGHAIPNKKNERFKDENCIRGLKNLIGLLENLETAVRKYTNIFREPGVPPKNPIMAYEEQEKSSHIPLAPGWHPFDQIAGRVINKGGKMLGFLSGPEGNVWKPDPSQQEIDFYEKLRNTEDPILIELTHFVPSYYSLGTMTIENERIRFINLENILKDFELPCRVDVKMGIKSRPDWAPPKVTEGKYKYKAMLSVWRFAIPAYERYRVPVQADAKPEKNSRECTHHMKPMEGVKTLYDFVNGKWGIRCGLVDSLLAELREIESWFERQRHYRFYDSSVFLTYDAKRLDDFAKGLLTESDCRSSKVPIKVRMIDFGNTFTETDEDEPDENYLGALRNLMWILDKVSKNEFDPKLLCFGHGNLETGSTTSYVPYTTFKTSTMEKLPSPLLGYAYSMACHPNEKTKKEEMRMVKTPLPTIVI